MNEQDSFDALEQWLDSLTSITPRPPQVVSPAPLYVASIMANGWTVDTYSHDLAKLQAHYSAHEWTEERCPITGNAEWFGETKERVLYVVITATKSLA